MDTRQALIQEAVELVETMSEDMILAMAQATVLSDTLEMDAAQVQQYLQGMKDHKEAGT